MVDSSFDSSPLLDRRDVLCGLGVGAAALTGIGALAAGQDQSRIPSRTQPVSPEQMGWDPKAGRYVLPPLKYEYGALEPHIDEETMRLHHDKHHAGYVRGLNSALEALAEIRAGERNASEIKAWSRALAFHGSGHALHVVFFGGMSPSGGGRPSGTIARQIDRDFGSFNEFANQFKAASGAVEGSGWGLLVLEPTSRRLMVMQSEKHQNLTMWGVAPIVAIDVWEHAYYLKYQNQRKAYVSAFMNVIDWNEADRRLEEALA